MITQAPGAGDVASAHTFCVWFVMTFVIACALLIAWRLLRAFARSYVRWERRVLGRCYR